MTLMKEVNDVGDLPQKVVDVHRPRSQLLKPVLLQQRLNHCSRVKVFSNTLHNSQHNQHSLPTDFHGITAVSQTALDPNNLSLQLPSSGILYSRTSEYII